jgi:hypothetical protein
MSKRNQSLYDKMVSAMSRANSIQSAALALGQTANNPYLEDAIRNARNCTVDYLLSPEYGLS